MSTRKTRPDWALMLLNNSTEEALEAFVTVSSKGASKEKIAHLRAAQKSILDDGIVPRSE
jgi:hypothetical protein